jgi:antitoxin PrlF
VPQSSKLTARFQAYVPTAVRRALQLQAGDHLGFEILDGEVRLHRASPSNSAFSLAIASTLNEWESAKDNKAFKDL